jgi:transposase
MGDPIRGRNLSELRRRAVKLADEGLHRGAICAELDIAPSTAWRWIKLHRQGELVVEMSCGRRLRLTPEQVVLLEEKLLSGPEACGYETPLWTLARIADVIFKSTGVCYSTNHISHLMRGLGWSCQKPARRAKERNEEAIVGWVRDEWPAVKKKPKH